MNYSRNFIEMLFRIRKPYSEEEFVIKALDSDIEHSNSNTAYNEYKEYVDAVLQFLLLIKEELKNFT